MKRIIIALCMLYLFGGNLSAKVVLPQILSDHAVLQQQTEVKLWGKAVPNTTVNVTPSWNNQTITAQSDNEGRWQVSIQTPAADFTPYSIEFSDGEITRIQNILIGEVWFCSGQSNMEMPLNGFWNCPIEHANETIATSGEWNAIRMATIPKTGALTPQEHVAGSWKESNPFNAPYFSATAFNFARMLHRVLRVPVGIISCAWGGSRVEGWLPREVVEGFRDVDLKKEIKKPEKGKEWDYYTPTVMYNGMLKPLQRYTIRGFLWYQGESNIFNYQFYAPMMTAMVQLWRNVWEAPDMPFYYVQIAPYKYENSRNTGAALLREAQVEALKTIPNSGIVPTTDIGDEFCIHPPQKDVVGLRLATLALTKTYGIRRLPSNGPMMTKVDYADKKAIVTFDNAPAGLFPTFSELEGFEIAGADKKFYPAKAKIVGRTNTVEVWSEEVAQPVAVRYAFRNYVGNITLRNTFGLSAFPFRTDTWDDVK